MRKQFVRILPLFFLLGIGAGHAWSQPPIIQSRTILARQGGYFPVLIRLHNGRLLCVFRKGAPHLGVTGRLDLASSDDGGKSWTRSRTVVAGKGDHRNPALGQLADGDLLLSYMVLGGYDAGGTNFAGPNHDGRHGEGVYLLRSRDGGDTWTKPVLVSSDRVLQSRGSSSSPYGKIVQAPDGTVLLSVYSHYPDARGDVDYVLRSHDSGMTWGRPILVAGHTNETGLLVLPNGTVLAAMRTEKRESLSISISSDEGKTWSAPVPVTRDREHPGDLILLRDGRVLLSFGERNPAYGVAAILSNDGGSTWDASSRVTLVSDCVTGDCGYPSSVQLPDGSIVTAYYRVGDPKDAPASTTGQAVIWKVAKRSAASRH